VGFGEAAGVERVVGWKKARALGGGRCVAHQ
jgi:hypothetical protein